MGTVNRRLATLLGLLIVAAFGPLVHGQFVEFDDDVYVFDNPQVRGGLSPAATRWAFATFHAGNWHPLTWVSHQLDVSLFGLRPPGHHLTSVALHAANAALLFALLLALTGRSAPSAVVAALFAVHPLHVESVAWVSERKDVLAACLGLLSLRAYLAWLRARAARWYLLAVAAFAAGLLAKPMIVTLPFLMLLLDYWPLGRLAIPGGAGRPAANPGAVMARLLAEKAPFVLLAAASSAITLVAQGRGGMFHPLPPAWRVANALRASAHYVFRTAWPLDLTAFYPHPEASTHAGETALAAAFLAGVSAAALLVARRLPWLFVGWHWYLGMLIPVVGLVQVGNQAHADRYTYLPLVGIFLIAAWGLPRLLRGPRLRPLLAGAAVLGVLALAGAARRQAGTWQDSGTLFTHMLAVTEGNWIGHNGVGLTLAHARRFEEAAARFREAVRVRPDFFMGWSNLGNALLALGHPEAVAALEQALRLKPDYLPAYSGLIWFHLGARDVARAEAVLRRLGRVDARQAAALDRTVAPFRRPGAGP